MILALPIAPTPRAGHVRWPSAFLESMVKLKSCRRSAHNVLMLGPPGAGKSMLAHRPAISPPPMPLAAAIETIRIHSPIALSGSRIALVTTPHFAPYTM